MSMIPPLKCSNPNCTLEVFDGAKVEGTCPCGGMYAAVGNEPATPTLLGHTPPVIWSSPPPEPVPLVEPVPPDIWSSPLPEPPAARPYFRYKEPKVEPEPQVEARDVVTGLPPVTDLPEKPARKPPMAIVATVIVGLLITAVVVVLMVKGPAADANGDTATASNPLAPPPSQVVLFVTPSEDGTRIDNSVWEAGKKSPDSENCEFTTDGVRCTMDGSTYFGGWSQINLSRPKEQGLALTRR